MACNIERIPQRNIHSQFMTKLQVGPRSYECRAEIARNELGIIMGLRETNLGLLKLS